MRWERFEIDGERWAHLPTWRRVFNAMLLVALTLLAGLVFSWVTGDPVTWVNVAATIVGVGIAVAVICVWLPARATRRR